MAKNVKQELLLSIGVDLDKKYEQKFTKNLRTTLKRGGHTLEKALDFTKGLKQVVSHYTKQRQAVLKIMAGELVQLQKKEKLLHTNKAKWVNDEIVKIEHVKNEKLKAVVAEILVLQDLKDTQESQNKKLDASSQTRLSALQRIQAQEFESAERKKIKISLNSAEKVKDQEKKLIEDMRQVRGQSGEEELKHATKLTDQYDELYGSEIKNIKDLTSDIGNYKKLLDSVGEATEGLDPTKYISGVSAMTQIANKLLAEQKKAEKENRTLSSQAVEEIANKEKKRILENNKIQESLLKKHKKMKDKIAASEMNSVEDLRKAYKDLSLTQQLKGKLPGYEVWKKASQRHGERKKALEAVALKERAEDKAAGGKGEASGLTKLLSSIGPLITGTELLGAGIMALVKLFIDAQAQAHEFNKAMLDGVGIGGATVKSFGDVSSTLDSVRDAYQGDVAANLKWMKSGKEQGKVLNELAQSGVALETVFTDTADPAKTAAERWQSASNMILTYSTQLGTSTSDIAKFTGDMMQNFLMNLNQVHDSFGRLTEVQKESGIGSARFFAAVQSITGQIGTMDSGLDYTAKALSKVIGTSVLGVDKTAKAMGSLESTMTDKQAMFALGFLSDEDWKKLIKDQEDRNQERTDANEKAHDEGTIADKQYIAEKAKIEFETDTLEAAKKGGPLQKLGLAKSGVLDPQAEQQAKLIALSNALVKSGVKGNNIMNMNRKELSKYIATGGELLNEQLEQAGMTKDELVMWLGPMAEASEDTRLGTFLSMKQDKKDVKKDKSLQQQQLDEAQATSRNTADLMDAVDIGMEYILNEIYDATLKVFHAITNLPGFGSSEKEEAEYNLAEEMSKNNSSIRNLKQSMEAAKKKGNKTEVQELDQQIKKLEAENKQMLTAKDKLSGGASVDEVMMGLPESISKVLARNLKLRDGMKFKQMAAAALPEEGFTPKTSNEEIINELKDTLASNAVKIELLGDVSTDDRQKLMDNQEAIKAALAEAQSEKDEAEIKKELGTKDVYGVSKGGYLPFPISEGDVLVQKDSLADAMSGPAGAALPNVTPTGAAAGMVTININGGDVDRVRKVVFDVLHQYESEKRA